VPGTAEALAVLTTFELKPYVLHDTPSRRLVRSFGLARVAGAYDLGPAAPIPAELDWVRDRCAGLMGREPEELTQLLVSRYSPGAGIGWHRDAPQFGDVSGVSLLTACRMRFRRGRTRARETAEPPSSPAPRTSCPVRRGHNGTTTSLRSRRSGGR
jgi:hypothetical protein